LIADKIKTLRRDRSEDIENSSPNIRLAQGDKQWTPFELGEVRQQLLVMQQQLLLKSNIVDVCALVDLKANAADTERAIAEIHLTL
jgi:hypothetical protein